LRSTFTIAGCVVCSLWIIGGPALQTSIPVAEAAQSFDVQLSASHDTVTPAQIFVYTVKVQNRGSALENASVILSLHEDLEVEYASDSGRSRKGSVTWEKLTFAANEERTFTASVRVKDSANDSDTLTATAIAGGGFDEISVRVEDEDDPNNDDERPITIELYTDKPQVEPGESFSFIVSIINHGTRRVNGIEATVDLDTSLTFLTASHRGKGDSNRITWKDMDIQGEESRTVTASVQVSDDAEHGESLFSTAYAEGAVFEHKLKVWDPDFTKEQFKLYAFSDTEEVVPGAKITYTLRVRNLADHDERATIEAYLDPKVSFESATEDGMQFEQSLAVWEHATFKQSETKSFEITVVVDDDARPGTAIRTSFMAGIDRREIVTGVVAPPPKQSTGSNLLSNLSAGLFSAQGTTEQAENATQPQQASVELTKRADKDEVQPGSTVTYAVHVRNTSEEALQNVQVIDRFPEKTMAVVDAGSGVAEAEGIHWTIVALEPRAQWSGTYQVRTAQDLKHGDVIQTVTEVQIGGSTIAQLASTTNIITELPQAGEGPVVRAFANAQETLQPIQEVRAYDGEETAAPAQSANGFPGIVWFLTIGTGAALGIGAGIRWPRRQR